MNMLQGKKIHSFCQIFILFLLSFHNSMKFILSLYFQYLFCLCQTSKREGWLYNIMLKNLFFKNLFITQFVSTLFWSIAGHIFNIEIFIVKLYYILWSLIFFLCLNYLLYLILKVNYYYIILIYMLLYGIPFHNLWVFLLVFDIYILLII